MIVEAMEFQLKDGRTAVIRSPREEDVPALIDYLYRSTSETEFLLRYPEECDYFTPEVELQFIEHLNETENNAMLLCLVDGQLAGNCQIKWSTLLKTRHRAEIAIGILQDYWNLGIGTKLLSELLNIARNNPHIIQVELGFIEGNRRAQALYEKLGFRIVGVKPNAVRLRDGTLLHEYSMIHEIRR